MYTLACHHRAVYGLLSQTPHSWGLQPTRHAMSLTTLLSVLYLVVSIFCFRSLPISILSASALLLLFPLQTALASLITRISVLMKTATGRLSSEILMLDMAES